jgi:uncharacterized RDD family membrane protein YckC
VTARTNHLLIRTPEGIVFSLTLASPVTRFLAWFLDLLCIMVILMAVNTVVGMLQLVSPDVAQALAILLFFGISIGYTMALEWFWRGQTVGKKLFRLRVVDAEGLRLQASQIVVRNLLRAVDILPGLYLVGGLACLLSPRAQRLGDLAANTVVIRSPKITQPDLDQVMAGKFNSLRDYPHLEARLRQRVSPAEAGVALQAVLRRDLIEPGERMALFGEIADCFRAKVAFPSEATAGLTDEQYVRNVVDVIYRARAQERVLGQAEGPVENSSKTDEPS